MTPIPESDADLARRVSAGPDPAGAFERLHERHHGRLLAFLLTRFPDIAEDVAQDTWVKALDRLSLWAHGMSNFRGWLFQIARNLALDAYRRKRGVPLGEPDEYPAGTPSPLDGLLDTERRDVMLKCLEKLGANLLTVIKAAASGEAPDDIAKRLGITRSSVDQRKSRGLASLRECVEARLS